MKVRSIFPRRSMAVGSVLIATDFSRLAAAAVTYTSRLLPSGARLHLLNVQHPQALSPADYRVGPWSPAARAEHRRHLADCQRRLDQLAARLTRAHGFRVSAAVMVDWQVAPAICATARRKRAALIAVGSHGNTGLKSVFLGSVAQGVLNCADRPVLVVRHR
ncbi:MAG: universal stress protein [Opitutae bacterium]|nr:universal stress protein [Opitutae bacterium]